jgi:hypothetical protein
VAIEMSRAGGTGIVLHVCARSAIQLVYRTSDQKNLQFVTDAEGRKTAVILTIEEYEEMMEELKMGRAARESKCQPHWPLEDVVEESREELELKVPAVKAELSQVRQEEDCASDKQQIC